MPKTSVGTIESVIGPVVDFVFPEGELPEIYDAVWVEMENGKREMFEVEQQLGDRVVRSVAMGSTEGLRRGMVAGCLGEPFTVPVGTATLGRIFNVTGEPIDGKGRIETEERYAIHRQPPPSTNKAPRQRCSRLGSR